MKLNKLLFILLPSLLFGQFKVDLTTTPNTISYQGDVVYEIPHADAYGNALSYTPTITQNEFLKLTPGLTLQEADNITFAGDTITITIAGDYLVLISVRFSGTNANDIWEILPYKNGEAVANVGSWDIRTTSAGQADTRSFFWYLTTLVIGDDISFRMTNTSATRDPTFSYFKFYIEKKAEL